MGQVERGMCLCCASEPITVKNFDIGHVVAFSRGGSNEIENLRPICGYCNNSMGTQHMADYQRSMYPDAPAICGEDPVGDAVLVGGGADGTVYITMEHVEAIQPVVARSAVANSHANTCQQYSFCLIIIVVITFVVLMVI